MFGGFGNGQSMQYTSINPEARYRRASEAVKKAERDYAEAEDKLIRARRELDTVYIEWRKFNGYDLQKDLYK